MDARRSEGLGGGGGSSALYYFVLQVHFLLRNAAALISRQRCFLIQDDDGIAPSINQFVLCRCIMNQGNQNVW